MAIGVLRFWRDNQGAVHCPEGHRMRFCEQRSRASGPRERHELAQRYCGNCPQRSACRGDQGQGAHAKGRRIDILVGAAEVVVVNATPRGPRVSLPLATIQEVGPPRATPAYATVPPAANTSLLWLDTTAASARNALRVALTSLRVDVSFQTLTVAPAPTTTPTRAQRAHRRRDHHDHLRRNTANGSSQWNLRFHGVPPALAEHLGIKMIL